MDVAIRNISFISDKTKRTFWKKVDTSGGCWQWLGCKGTGGYGVRTFQKTTWLAHRLAWLFTYGKQAEKFLLHSCDNRLCVNPAHLREGDHTDNARDRVSRDRSAKGSAHGRAKVTEEDVADIDRLFYVKGMTKTAIAKKYNVTTIAIVLIIKRTNWAHIPPYDGLKSIQRNLAFL